MAELKARYSLVVMAKAPHPGKVKTRLIPLLGSRRATAVYQRLLSNILQALTSVEARRVLSCAPDSQHAVFRQLATRYCWQRQRQPQGGLGYRMSRIISSCQRQSDATIIVGSDLANLDAQFMMQCIDKLNTGHDVVLGATEDGGYGLIAMSRLHSGLFRRIPWSTNRVLQVTLGRARQLRLRTAVIDGLWDVDNGEDYRRWQQHY